MTDSQPRRWTNVYVQFSLPVADLEALDALLVRRGSSLGLEFRRALRACLLEAGIDPAGLDRPEDEVDADDHGLESA